ncbi:PqiB family protein [Cupriavidus sp. 8B]
MASPPELPEPDALPEAVVAPQPRWRLQLIWLIPLIAVLIGVGLAVQSVLERGPTITISFRTGEGLEAGKTKLKFKDVDIGLIRSVTLSPDRKNVIASAEISKNAERLLVADSRFWVVRPRISGGTVSGLSTLLGGSFVAMDVGSATAKRRDYVGLETPPVFGSDVPGRQFVLKSEDIGSLDVGSPVFFRRLQVGQITAYELDPDGNGVTLKVFVNAPYDKYVNEDTRFWQASGVDVSIDAAGIKLETQSVVAILVGGLAFQSPPASAGLPPAPANAQFALFHTRLESMVRKERIVETYVFNFTKSSVRGLSVGAPVDFHGIVVGEVAAINTRFDPVKKEFSIPVEVHFYPERFTGRYASGPKGGPIAPNKKAVLDTVVARGFRAQLRSGNLLTGQLYIALDFFPNAPKAAVDWSKAPAEIPTVPGGLQPLQDSVEALLAKLNKVPIEGLGHDMQQTIRDAHTLLNRLDAEVIPQARGTLAAAREALDSANVAMQPDSALQENAGDVMRELSRTAAAFRNLADYLERHPEALIRGKSDEGK